MIKFLRHSFLPSAQFQGSNRAKIFACLPGKLGGSVFTLHCLSKSLASKRLGKGSLTRPSHCRGFGVWLLLSPFPGNPEKPLRSNVFSVKSSFNDQFMPWRLSSQNLWPEYLIFPARSSTLSMKCYFKYILSNILICLQRESVQKTYFPGTNVSLFT